MSLALLAIIGGVVGAVFSASLKALGAGGAEDRIAGAHDQMVFEQELGKDVARAACIQVSAGNKYGSCNAGFANSTIGSKCTATGILLCVGWPQVSDSSCHVAAYTTSSNKVRRQEYTVSSGGVATPYGSTGVSIDTVNVTISTTTAPAPSGYTWVGSLAVSVTNTGVTKGQPVDKLVLHPLATDPAGAGAEITSVGPPC